MITRNGLQLGSILRTTDTGRPKQAAKKTAEPAAEQPPPVPAPEPEREPAPAKKSPGRPRGPRKAVG